MPQAPIAGCAGDNMTDHNLQQLFGQNLMMLQEIKDDIKDLREDVGDLKINTAVVKNDVQNLKNEVSDLKLTVTNHINSDIHNSNKKSISKSPTWMVILLVFLLGRLSMSLVNVYDNINSNQNSQKLPSQISNFAEPSSTLVVSNTKSTNQKINEKIIKKIIGE